MKNRLKQLFFKLLGKEPEGVVVSFLTGEREQALAMLEEVLGLVPGRRHFAVTTGDFPLPEGVTRVTVRSGSALSIWLELRRRLGRYRVGLAPLLLNDPAYRNLRRAAVLFAPLRILAYNRRLERHHVGPRSPIASILFLAGVPLDRIFLRPRWLFPFGGEQSWQPTGDDYGIFEGRAFSPKRRRIAIVSPYFPYPMSHGGAVRIYNLLRELSREFDILLLTFIHKLKAEHTPPVEQFCARIFVVPAPRYREPRWSTLCPPEVKEYECGLMGKLIAWVRDEFQAELVQLEYTAMASYPGEILVEHDVTFDLYRQIHERERTLRSAFNLWRWKRFEKAAIARSKRVVVMSDKDAKMLGGEHVRVIPNGVDLKRFQPQPETAGRRLVFVGSFCHFPNVQAFRFLAEEVWPLVRAKMPDATLTVVAGPDPLLYWDQHTGTKKPPEQPGIEILAMTRDVRPLLAKANLALVPTLVSAGTNLKVIEALAMERAVVSTTSGAGGLGLEHGTNVWIADGAAAFAEGVVTLLADDALRSTLARNGRALAVEKFGWQVSGELNRALIRELLAPRSRIRPATRADLGEIRRIQDLSPGASRWEPERYLVYDARVAEVAGLIAGFLITRQTADRESEVLNLAIDPEHRRMGIASELMRDVIKRQPGELFLEVRESNGPALGLYRKLGFEEAGVRRNYYEDPPEAAIVMRLRTC